MKNFRNDSWYGLREINSRSFVCWNCGNRVASNHGYTTVGELSCIYICPHCNAPHIIDEQNQVIPEALPGKPVKRLPKEIAVIYDEARNCIAAGANTAAVMVLRKILMNLAVEEGAKEGDSFENYIKFLCDNGFVHRRQQKQAEHIKRLGNKANHKIEPRTKEDALELLNVVQLILINNYEQSDEFMQPEPDVVR